MNEMDWEMDERFPRSDDRYEFLVWISVVVIKVKRMGNRQVMSPPRTLIYLDCAHPTQNVICDEQKIRGWKLA